MMHATRFAIWLAVKIESRPGERFASCNCIQSNEAAAPMKFHRCYFRASRPRGAGTRDLKEAKELLDTLG
jgi:hypothetical protein